MKDMIPDSESFRKLSSNFWDLHMSTQSNQILRGDQTKRDECFFTGSIPSDGQLTKKTN